jgi:hypothetical protein
MDLRTMECFLAVVEEGSIARAGRVFAERTRRLLGHVEETSEAVRSIGQGVSGTIAIAIGSSVAPGLVAGLLRASRWWRSCAPITLARRRRPPELRRPVPRRHRGRARSSRDQAASSRGS